MDEAPEEELEVEDTQQPDSQVPVVAAAVAEADGAASLSDEDVERIAKRVVSLLGQDVLREVAWEVVPDLAEVVIKARIRELESHLE